MARPRKTPAPEETAKQAGALENLDELLNAEALNPALQDLYNELGIADGQATVHVTLLEADGQEARIWRGVPDDYDLEQLARKFGSGDYRVKVYAQGEQGYKVVRGNRVIRMKLPPDDDARIRAEREAKPVAPVGPLLTAEAVAAAVRAAIPPAPPQPAFNVMEIVGGLATLVKTITPPAPAATAQAQVNPLDVLRTVVGVVRDMQAPRGRDDDESPRRGNSSNAYDVWTKLIDKFAPMFQQVMQQVPQTLPPGAQPAPLPVDPSASAPLPAPAPAINPPEETMVNGTEQQLRMGIQFLLAQANAGHDPETYADVVIDNVPEESLDYLLDKPDTVGFIVSIVPEVESQRDWFTRLFAAIREQFEDDDGDEAAEGPDAAQLN